MAIKQDALMSAPIVAGRKNVDERSLFSPVVDFFLLGGGSAIILAILVLTLPVDTGRPVLLMIGLMLAHVINHPHFAYSYQIFYSGFGAKIRGDGYNRELQIRYILAGIVVPVALTCATAGTILAGDAQALGLGLNIMFFFVGWHYVKQGYGMLMLDAALKKRFFTPAEKKLLLVNSYVAWICHWIVANTLVHESDRWGLKSYTIDMPAPLFYGSMVAAAALLLATIVALTYRLFIARKPLPVNGVVAYFVSIYVWLFAAFYPIVGAIVPAFHSLQYLAVVWRYRLNLEAARPDARTTPLTGKLSAIMPKIGQLRFISFLVLGAIIGYLGFWGVPKLLNAIVPYDREVFGPTLFLFVFWIFINVHHYFLDNVMWRRGNPDVQKHLFA